MRSFLQRMGCVAEESGSVTRKKRRQKRGSWWSKVPVVLRELALLLSHAMLLGHHGRGGHSTPAEDRLESKQDVLERIIVQLHFSRRNDPVRTLVVAIVVEDDAGRKRKESHPAYGSSDGRGQLSDHVVRAVTRPAMWLVAGQCYLDVVEATEALSGHGRPQELGDGESILPTPRVGERWATSGARCGTRDAGVSSKSKSGTTKRAPEKKTKRASRQNGWDTRRRSVGGS